MSFFFTNTPFKDERLKRKEERGEGGDPIPPLGRAEFFIGSIPGVSPIEDSTLEARPDKLARLTPTA